MTVNMHRAKTELSKLVEAAERGEEIIILRDGKPVVKLVPVVVAKVQFGALRGEVKVPESDDWWRAMTDEEVAGFLGGNSKAFPNGTHVGAS